MNTTAMRSRWAAVGAAVAITLGAGGIGLVSATSPAGAVAYVPLDAPCRGADTRPGDDNVGDKASPIGPGETHTINSNDGDCDGLVPGSATGLQLNVTSLNSTIPSFLTIWASGDRPTASSLNPTPGQPPVPNAVTTAITGAGDFNIFNNAGNVDVVVDIVGYYTDHNHDDRYYQKSEVDAAVGGVQTAVDEVESNVATVASDVNNMTRVHFARVATNGTVQKTSNQAISVTKAGTGLYDVVLPEPAANCAVESALHAQTSGFGLLIGLVYLQEGFTFSTHNTAGDANTVRIATAIRDADDDSFGEYTDMAFTITAYCSDPVFVFDPGVIIPPIIVFPGP